MHFIVGKIHQPVILFGYVMLCMNLAQKGQGEPVAGSQGEICDSVSSFLLVGCKQTYSWRKLCVGVGL